jgi:hypothetical protein
VTKPVTLPIVLNSLEIAQLVTLAPKDLSAVDYPAR